ncbi:hypothetical protein L3X38_025440 [Prunus dulcis]|uniref:Uncharacterized protein n=1 Tax=Prunus dulcis TaxID=3755 RepID=A0AAD4W3J9_PRUDU|nr:hypothetical protein L3X38_025440 [Prunus dulcis]
MPKTPILSARASKFPKPPLPNGKGRELEKMAKLSQFLPKMEALFTKDLPLAENRIAQTPSKHPSRTGKSSAELRACPRKSLLAEDTTRNL